MGFGQLVLSMEEEVGVGEAVVMEVVVEEALVAVEGEEELLCLWAEVEEVAFLPCLSICHYLNTGGGVEQCRTVVEAVTSVVQETAFETQCAMVSDRECKTEIQTSYSTTLETQCSPGYGTKCKPQQKTAYRKFCTTVQDTECRVTVQSGSKTTYEQQCSTSYEKKCSGHGYHQKCENVPKQDCQQVPKQVAVSNPVRQCSQVPKERCHQVSGIN